MLRFNRNNLQEEFDSGTYSRGVGYYNQGRVGEVSYHSQAKNMLVITSRVRGSYHYQQNILVEKLPSGIDVEGTCDCPVGYNCKHVVSALLKYIEELLPASSLGSNNAFSKSMSIKTKAQEAETQLNDWIHKKQYRGTCKHFSIRL